MYFVYAEDCHRPRVFSCCSEKLSLCAREVPPMRKQCGVYNVGSKPSILIQMRRTLLNCRDDTGICCEVGKVDPWKCL